MFFTQDSLNLQIIGAFQITRKSTSFHTTGRNYHVVSQRISGDAQIFHKGDIYSLKEGDLIYLPPNIDYAQSTDGESIIAVHMKINGYEGEGIQALTPQDPAGIRSAFQRIYEEWQAQKCGYQYRSLAILYDLLADLHVQLENAMTHSREFDLIKDAVQYMESRYTDSSLTIEQCAARSSISTVYFRRVFRSVYGVSPLKYLNSLRMEYAKRLLASDYYRVYEVADMAGFSDVKYFSTVFKKETGSTPSEYKE